MNIYISNLNFKTSSESLNELFAQHGEVSSANIITDRESGRSRGFGFVEMTNDEEAKQAISSLNETDFEGKTITVQEARPKTDRPSNGGGGFNRGGGGGYGSRRY